MKSYSGKLRQSSNNCWQHENIKNCPKTAWTLFEVGEKLLRCQRQKQEQQGYSGKTIVRTYICMGSRDREIPFYLLY